MTRYFSLLVAWACLFALFAAPTTALVLLLKLDSFAHLAQRNLALPTHWQSVVSWQWFALWLLTAVYMGIGLPGLYFLRRAFLNFSKGAFFEPQNSRDLRLFSIFLFAQAVSKPVYHAAASVLLSLNHPPGQKILSIVLGSDSLKVIFLTLILWVVSDLLVKGNEIDTENKQFI